MKKSVLVSLFAILCCGCTSTSRVTTIQSPSASADTPYDNILVITLFESFDLRRYLETEIVNQLKDQGIRATASTSMMDTRTPVTRQTFRGMVDSLDADAVLITQLTSLESAAKMKDANPESTYNIRPTYYFDVWSVELTEYVAPQNLHLKNTVLLATQLISVRDKGPVWAIEVESKFARDFDKGPDYSIIVDEASAITRRMARDGLVSR